MANWEKFHYIGKFMLCDFFKFHNKKKNALQAIESATPPKKWRLWFNGVYVTKKCNKTWKIHIKAIFRILSTIFSHILCLVRLVFVPKILNTKPDLNTFFIILDPFTRIIIEVHSFARFWTVLQKPKMRPYRQQNSGLMLGPPNV